MHTSYLACTRVCAWHTACRSVLMHRPVPSRRAFTPQIGANVAAALCCLVSGCTAPIVYPRSADLLDGGRTRFRLGVNAVGVAPTSARVELEPGTSTTISGLSASRAHVGSSWSWILEPLVSPERGFDVSLDLCETGGLLSFVRIGAELRCGVLQQDSGAPFSLAASSAYLYPVDIGDLTRTPTSKPVDARTFSRDALDAWRDPARCDSQLSSDRHPRFIQIVPLTMGLHKCELPHKTTLVQSALEAGAVSDAIAVQRPGRRGGPVRP
jgi:hypothetical protein